jgi:Protein of unknown function (DUF3662)/FHA domain
MGLLRRVESRIQGGFEGVFGRKSGGGVQPTELARMLVKEMDDRAAHSLARVYAPNHFTVYLCTGDRAKFRPREASLAVEFADHLELHAREKAYSLTGRTTVVFASDADLRAGQFGILAEMVELPLELPLERPTSEAGQQAAPPSLGPGDGQTQGIPARVATDLGLARQTLQMRHGSHVQEFQKSRVVMGRSRDADFRLDDPNISRRHAVVYWEAGQAFVKDLGSTNGTLLNGRPIASAALDDGDVLTLGGCTVVVETE